jgi:hypothetical protein
VVVVSAPPEAPASVESVEVPEPSLELNTIERKKGAYGASFLRKVIRDIQQIYKDKIAADRVDDAVGPATHRAPRLRRSICCSCSTRPGASRSRCTSVLAF